MLVVAQAGPQLTRHERETALILSWMQFPVSTPICVTNCNSSYTATIQMLGSNGSLGRSCTYAHSSKEICHVGVLCAILAAGQAFNKSTEALFLTVIGTVRQLNIRAHTWHQLVVHPLFLYYQGHSTIYLGRHVLVGRYDLHLRDCHSSRNRNRNSLPPPPPTTSVLAACNTANVTHPYNGYWLREPPSWFCDANYTEQQIWSWNPEPVNSADKCCVRAVVDLKTILWRWSGWDDGCEIWKDDVESCPAAAGFNGTNGEKVSVDVYYEPIADLGYWSSFDVGNWACGNIGVVSLWDLDSDTAEFQQLIQQSILIYLLSFKPRDSDDDAAYWFQNQRARERAFTV
ncbi:hypothetical protein BU25DRAFT_417385 [Macroventuria anomochaeta]|uniref:Uncharacterized protein n=1 Tax=Macroventuria anomochaeta TaxID=301207 RepID=A0ACB6SFH7_9PLEO|nr:uncharacterized protein BU25DRAFT_417385 [Macroventuria anomochaeta]KAF2632794.1 hypothetical protein BU25DRAFT_417385 [Macroventuria anomochaeta]